MNNIEELEQKILHKQELLNRLNKQYLKAMAPDSYPKGTSYNDYDTIHGSKKEYRVEDYWKERSILEEAIEIDMLILANIKNKKEEDEYLLKLDTTKDKVRYLRKVKGYTQERTAEILNMSERQIRRIDKELKMSCKMS